MSVHHSQDYPSPVDRGSDSDNQSNTVRVVGGYKDQFPDINERTLMLKVDFKLMPFICILYFFSFLDRSNIGNAAIYGMITDLKLHNAQFNTALVIFLIPEIVFQIPSNLLMKRFRPRVWLPVCVFLFGTLSSLQGTVKGFPGILAIRFLLGTCDSAIFPGLIYLMSLWYKRSEAQKRISFLFACINMAGVLSGLLAGAIGKMDGAGGYRAWRWVFILEGVMTCIASATMYFIGIPDIPAEMKWLSTEEKAFIKQRLSEDMTYSDPNAKITFKAVVNVLIDYKVILGGFMLLGLAVTAYSYAYFSPIIIESLGHSPIQTQLYSAYPFMVGFVLTMVTAIFSDMFQQRFIFYLISIVISFVGYLILVAVHNMPHVQYAAMCLAAAGNFSALSIIVCWCTNNLGGYLRKNVGTAWQIAFANIGGIVAAFTFVADDAPKYIRGYSICLGFLSLSLLSSVIYLLGIIIENRRRERGDVKGADLPEDEKRYMGDLNPDYRYML